MWRQASRLRAAGLALTFCALAAVASATPPELRFTFVGNRAFHVTDGEQLRQGESVALPGRER